MKKLLVIMPYKEPWSDKLWKVLESINKKNPELSIDKVVTRGVHEDNLDNHITEQIKNSDIILADITENNPNVMIEIGLALASNKPLIIFTQDRLKIPACLQGKIIEEYSCDCDDSLVKMQNLLYNRIKDKLEVIEKNDQILSNENNYCVDCYSQRKYANIETYFGNATDRIDILTTNLSSFFDKINGNISYFDEILTSLNRLNSKTRVRVLTLNPESDFASKRGKQLGYSPSVFRDALKESLKKVEKIQHEYPIDRFEVRTYDEFPNQITFRIDNNIFNCVVAPPNQSRNQITFKLDIRKAGVESSFITHFQNVWKDAQNI